MKIIQAVRQRYQPVVVFRVGEQPLWQARIAVVRAGDGTRHGGDGVGVMASVHGGEEGLLEVLRGGQEAPEGAWEGLQDVGPV
jgi:hypothetical protein